MNIGWLDNTDDLDMLYDFETPQKSSGNNVMGDGRLLNMTGFKTYSSNCQKLIIRAIENQIDGTTILATMPTGGGKSLPVQFVSYYEYSGTTIVVVPTIALAIDQSKSARKLFNGNRNIRAYYDGISRDEKVEIFKELQGNKIAILYLSPESILNGSFNEQILVATQKGIIKRLVIDEAHIVAEWGEFFRTEFQFLSIFRKKLLVESRGELKTILLSATVTKDTENILRTLYSEENKFIQIRGDSLRNEIIYYIKRCQNDGERQKRILELIPMLPRPLIIYVPIIEKATSYYELLKNVGINRVEKFTSETNSSERERIMRGWENDRIDIIIATSAFGMGVNKKEVRAVIHTFVPESIDRFYQEVGRGGRDGYNSLSFIFTSLKEDEDHIQFFTSSKVLSVDKILERWNSLLDNYIEKKSGDELWITPETVPNSLKGEGHTGNLNIAWNEYVILFLYRQGIIDILDLKLDSKSKKRVILIKLLKLDLINNKDRLKAYLEPIRANERLKVDNEIHYVKEMIKSTNTCWGNHFSKVYKLTEEKCNGCPNCRASKHSIYRTKDYFEVYENKNLLRESFLKNREFKERGVIVKSENFYREFYKILEACIENNIDCLVLDKNIDMDSFDYYKLINSKIYVYRYEDLIRYNERNYICGNVAIIFSEDDSLNDKLYNYTHKLIENKKICTSLFIAHGDIKIISEGKRISNLIDGTIKYIGGK